MTYIHLSHILTAGIALLLLIVLRIYLLLPSRSHDASRPSNQRQKRKSDEQCSLGIFLGSGGHTSEMTTLLSGLDLERYSPRVYVLCHGDKLSLSTIQSVEDGRASAQSQVEHVNPNNSTSDPNKPHQEAYSIILLPRARRVGQSWFSTLFTTFRTILVALVHTFLIPLFRNPRKPWVDVLLINGPGTCVVLVLVAWIRRVLGLPYTRIIYVESFARVKSLSLSAKILRHFVDAFVVQWPEAAGLPRGNNVTYKGWLV